MCLVRKESAIADSESSRDTHQTIRLDMPSTLLTDASRFYPVLGVPMHGNFPWTHHDVEVVRLLRRAGTGDGKAVGIRRILLEEPGLSPDDVWHLLSTGCFLRGGSGTTTAIFYTPELLWGLRCCAVVGDDAKVVHECVGHLG